ncbi:hypothetical protein RN001_003998 [Aquatica leii]|uniref:Uncharacterized protein n=1 Tax=Aquatica leii TaxID=1421715 RepID=A0AAN7PJ48_9COLE|nr:hypothetical protein RN001_003998 [Aquatica leii]
MNEIGDCRDPKYLYPNLRICGLHFNRSGRKTKFDILPKYLSTVTQDCTNIPLNTCNPVSQDTSLNFNATNENDHSYCIPSTNDLIYKIKILQSKCQSLMTKYVKKVKENAELLGNNNALKIENTRLKSYVKVLKEELLEVNNVKNNLTLENLKLLKTPTYTVPYEDILNNNRLITFFTGFKDLAKFESFYELICEFQIMCATNVGYASEASSRITYKEQIFLVLTRLSTINVNVTKSIIGNKEINRGELGMNADRVTIRRNNPADSV